MFVVGYLGDWRNPAKVLFEQESLRGDTQKGKKERQGTAENSYNGSGASSEGVEIPKIIPTITIDLARQVTNQLIKDASAFFHIYSIHDQATRNSGKRGSKNDGKGNGLGVSDNNKSYTLTSGDKHAVAYSFDSLSSNSMKSSNPHSGVREVEKSRTLDTTLPTPDKNQGGIGIVEKLKVRRLTPIEAERLQGFEDDYTKIPYRGKPKEQCPDGPRYKAMGNSMAVPVVRWIGERIKMVNDNV